MEKRRKETEDGGFVVIIHRKTARFVFMDRFFIFINLFRYDECYPGGLAEMEGCWDSDEEDFSKMDLGNKKPPVKRWDFEDQEEYEKYQVSRYLNIMLVRRVSSTYSFRVVGKLCQKQHTNSV